MAAPQLSPIQLASLAGLWSLLFCYCESLTKAALPTQVRWITFHSGYDFGYLLKVLTCQALPSTEKGFFAILQVGSDKNAPLTCDCMTGPLRSPLNARPTHTGYSQALMCAWTIHTGAVVHVCSEYDTAVLVRSWMPPCNGMISYSPALDWIEGSAQ